MFRINIPSEDVRSVGYDRDNKILEIELLSTGIIRYSKVPEKTYIGLLNAKSYEDYWINKIKYIYPYERVVTS
jgi:hypothetical protein